MTSLKDIDLKSISWSDLIDSLLYEAFHFGVKLAICIVIYIVGRKIIQYINYGIGKLMSSKQFDPSVASFLKSLINIILTAALLIMIVNILGINNSSFVALLASVGVALGMALSGTLQNFSGGVMILLFRPYKIGDYIQAQGQEGTVKEIQIFNTVIVTADNRTVFIPNGGLSSNIIVNYNEQKTRRVEWVIGVDYGTDYNKAKEIILGVLKTDKRILIDPKPLIVLKTLNESSVDIQIRVWVNLSDYWDVYYNINEQIYKTFAAQGIEIPFPQLTVHLNKE
ncbi:MAG: mechanosensitive ion channel [Dysgonamonadaceae bacterium]|jgi:small conductance mechanosensitive channel|nr:mechanosensitive ion channel [Dysgonamonadaceae bacterium]